MQKYYYLYEIYIDDDSSNLNGCYYYGKRESSKLEDDYYGSGKIIQRYIKKHGTSKLRKTILSLHSDSSELKTAEQILIEEKQILLQDRCINMHEGGSGGHWVDYCSDEEYKWRCNRVSEGMRASKPPEFWRDNARRAALSKRNVSKERKQEWTDHYRAAHKRRTPEEKMRVYSKVSESLKHYYDSCSTEELELKTLKNKQTNIESARRWRGEFFTLFGRTPESFRSCGLMKSAIDLYKKIKNLDKVEIEYEVSRFMESVGDRGSHNC